MLEELRRALEVQARLIASRLEAVDQAEAALARLREVFGMPDAQAAPEKPVEEREAVDRPILPSEAASPAVASAAAARQAICARCSRSFTPPPLRPGPPRRLCDDCRQRRPIRQGNGEAEPEPELAPEPAPAPEQQHRCRYCEEPFSPSQRRAGDTCSELCANLLRTDGYARDRAREPGRVA